MRDGRPVRGSRKRIAHAIARPERHAQRQRLERRDQPLPPAAERDRHEFRSQHRDDDAGRKGEQGRTAVPCRKAEPRRRGSS